MNTQDFIEKINAIRRKYDFCIQEDCDLWSVMTGFVFYRNEHSEKPFAHITGISYTGDGKALQGDFKGFLKLLQESVDAEYGT